MPSYSYMGYAQFLSCTQVTFSWMIFAEALSCHEPKGNLLNQRGIVYFEADSILQELLMLQVASSAQ